MNLSEKKYVVKSNLTYTIFYFKQIEAESGKK